jgi:cellulose synthase/poly-beta-1,6-N-acetylglucosamine synthase-like glycosyltransferase
MHERGAGVGYASIANGLTIAPLSFDVLWSQRLRWFIGRLHNTLSIHRDLLLKKSWLTLLFYTPFYPILRLINIVARLTSSVKYFWVTMATGIAR